jgi:hypothetical protein
MSQLWHISEFLIELLAERTVFLRIPSKEEPLPKQEQI